MKKYIISENVFNKIKHLFLEQEDSEKEILRLSPSDYINYLKMVSGNGDLLPRIQKFKNKEIYITGPLELSNSDVKSLGPVKKINGNLDISHTKISQLPEDLEVSYIWDSGTPLEAKRKAKELRELRNDAEERRENGEWNLSDTDKVGEMANALLEYLENDGELEARTEEDNKRLSELYEKLNELQEKEDNPGEDESITDIVSEIEVIEDEINDIEEKKDVYELYVSGSRYDLTSFSLIGDETKEWAVGTESDVESSMYEYVESLIDDIGYTGFSTWVWESNLDNDALWDYFYDDNYNMVYDNPEGYGVEKELSSTQEQEIERLREKIEDLESERDDLDEDGEDYQELYDDLTETIESLESDIEDIESDPEEIDESDIEKVAERLTQEIVDDPKFAIENYGLDINQFIDKDGFIEDVVRSDGYGQLSGYDGTYDTIYINDTEYYIFRIN